MALKKRAGSGKDGVALRRKAFIHAYMTNGHNATRAAIAAGYSAKTASSKGEQVLRLVEASGELAAMAERAGEEAGLTTKRALKKLECVTFVDHRKLVDAEGNPKKLHELDDDTAAAIAGLGPNGQIQLHDSLKGLDMTFRHLGLYERDNTQRAESLNLQIVLVGKGAS